MLKLRKSEAIDYRENGAEAKAGAVTGPTRSPLWTSNRGMTKLMDSRGNFPAVEIMAICPECDAGFEVDEDVEEGQTLDCPECGAELEVVGTNPIELKVLTSGDEEEEEEFG